ncbi:fibronectin type III domain-containing protein [Lentilactobacillus parabuchneri]|uniref:fibronectin type III domain-containing protein n=1 Tax=Lentilactobacillus parabuchneri TaxID=152331 RepID=UPI00230722B0|nr:fibronectin type III domain-containing protein [Lentilactobacillus parabuchneri]MDB1104643.1 fibronectin type III domain-containing protein [Lentilactobacillus parabuchneri]
MADTNPSEFTVMTNAAVNLAAQALAGTSKIKFTKVIGSSAVHFSDNPESIAQLTDLAPNNQTGIIKYASKEGTNQSIVQADFDELNVSADYDLATIGLYASGDDGNEILYAVVCLQYPDHMIAGNSDTSSYYIRVVVGNTANLDVTVSPTGTVSNAQLESVLADYVKTDDLQKLIDTSDYAKLKEDNEFKGNNKFDIDPVNKDGNSYGLAKDIATKVTDNGDNSIEINKQAVTPVRDNKNGSINFNSKDMTPADDSKVVHTADMRKPASDVAGIEEVNAKQDKIGYTPADDSKVAHLSGANNFDTVPTVNNNPLLLASSLPTDLARTSQQTTFTAGLQSNGQDVLTVKTPGVPKLAVNYNVNSKAFDYTMTAPEKDGFSDIIQYNLLWKDHSVDDWKTVIVKPDDLTGQLTGVDITKTYDFKAAAQNAVGSSDFTDVITLPAASAPGIPSLTVEYDAGKKGFDYTVTAPESDGGSEITEYSLEYQKQGGTDWTKVALKPDSLTGTVTDGIEAGSDYLFRVNAENAVGSSEYFTVSDPLPTVDGNIYGVSWDGSSSGALQRTDAAVGLKAGINGAQNDFDTRGPWGLMDKTVTDSYGNAFVRVPKFYIRKTQNKPLSTWQVSLVKQGDDWYLPNCFYDFDNEKELDYVDVSRYEGSIASGKLQSKTGATPTTNQTIVQLRRSAVANNTDGKKGYHLWDVHTLDALQVLFTIEFATLDSQSIMKGVTDSILSGAEVAGATDVVKGSSGNVDHSNGYGSMTYRGIENLYGNLAMWTDGLNINNLSLYSCDDATKYASDMFASPYYKINYSLNSGNGNITGLGFDKDHPGVTAPTSFNSDSYNTYYHDYGYVNGSGNYVVYTGGGWTWGAGGSGLWYWDGVDSSTCADSDVGSRLLKKAL